MLDRLVASHPERSRGGAAMSAIFAVVLHGGLVTAAVLATWSPPRTAPQVVLIGDPSPYYVPARSADAARPTSPVAPRSWPTPDPGALYVPSPDVGPLPPVPGPGESWGPPRVGWTGPGSYGPAGPGSGGPGMPGTTLYSEAAVDEPPYLLTHPALEYPGVLRAAGLDGLVILEVVIDSTGVPEPGTLRVLEATHQGFVAEAARVVLGARFRPGRAQGRPVRVLIRQPISFRLTR